MHSSQGSQEQVVRQLAGISHILDSIAEEANQDIKAHIARAAQILSMLAPRCPGQSLPVYPGYLNPPDGKTLSQLIFDTTNVVTRQFPMAPFTNVEIDCAFIFQIAAGDSFNVAVNASESLFDYINVGRSGDTLKLSLKPVKFNYRPVLEARITMPALTRLRQGAATKGMLIGFRNGGPLDLYLSGASALILDADAGDVRIEISGASSVTGSLNAQRVDLMLSGASRVRLSGGCRSLLLSGWGAADLDLSGFPADDATIYLKGASQATVRVARKLDIDLTGASLLRYFDSPDLNEINLSGASILSQLASAD